MLYYNYYYLISGLFPSSGILKKTQRFGNWTCFGPQLIKWGLLNRLSPL
jgi:hypothetical protein